MENTKNMENKNILDSFMSQDYYQNNAETIAENWREETERVADFIEELHQLIHAPRPDAEEAEDFADTILIDLKENADDPERLWNAIAVTRTEWAVAEEIEEDLESRLAGLEHKFSTSTVFRNFGLTSSWFEAQKKKALIKIGQWEETAARWRETSEYLLQLALTDALDTLKEINPEEYIDLTF